LGSAVVRRLWLEGGREVVAAFHRQHAEVPAGVRVLGGLELGSQTEWLPALEGVTSVVHCAARAHVMRDTTTDPLAEFRRVNVDGTLNLARQAAQGGVKRFVFVSSIGVNGAVTSDVPFTADDRPAPHSPYAQSKFEAEQGLHRLAEETGLDVVIIRPPLVYGPGAPGNFGALVRAVRRGWPLPLGTVTGNRRSLVAIDNLVDLILTCLVHPAATNQTFLVSDGEDLSTADLLQHLGAAMGRPARLLPVPMRVLALGAKLLGKPEIFQSLCSSLQVDMSKTRDLLGWQPPIGVDEGLKRAVGASGVDALL